MNARQWNANFVYFVIRPPCRVLYSSVHKTFVTAIPCRNFIINYYCSYFKLQRYIDFNLVWMNGNRGWEGNTDMYTCRIETFRGSWSKGRLIRIPMLHQCCSYVIQNNHFVYLHNKATLLTRKPFDCVYDPVYMTYLMLLFNSEKWMVVLALNFLHRSTMLLYKKSIH